MADVPNNPAELVVPPPIPKLMDYPATFAVAFAVVFTILLLLASGRFDHSGGTLTISLLIVLAYIGTVTFCLFFTVPNDEITSSVIGGLTLAFGAIMAYWLGRPKG